MTAGKRSPSREPSNVNEFVHGSKRVPLVFAAEVFHVCVGHALTTEAEEVMGLLLGDVVVRPDVLLTHRSFANVLLHLKKQSRKMVLKTEEQGIHQ